MTPEELRVRSRTFAARTRRFCAPLLSRRDLGVGPGQLLRASSSAAANYRAACSAFTHRMFVAKMCVVLEESDESLFWAQYLSDAGITGDEIRWILTEADELTRIYGASVRTARGRGRHRPRPSARGDDGTTE